MASVRDIAVVAAVLGDPARAAMMSALLDGRALTAGELAEVAGVAAPTASAHLAQLRAAGLVDMAAQGRHRYHRLASAEVARLMESLMSVAVSSSSPAKLRVGPKDLALRRLRTCYDHLAGSIAVALADALVRDGALEWSEDGGALSAAGVRTFIELGIDPAAATSRRTFCRPCLDWSERRPHIAGRLGAALCSAALMQGWVRRRSDGRALDLTPLGQETFQRAFSVSL